MWSSIDRRRFLEIAAASGLAVPRAGKAAAAQAGLSSHATVGNRRNYPSVPGRS